MQKERCPPGYAKNWEVIKITEQEIKTVLQATGYPVAYHHFSSAQKPPFVVYLIGGKSGIGADNTVYQRKKTIRIELYTNKKDLKAEGRVESVLDAAGLFYSSEEVWIESEKLYQINYESEVFE